jgi:type II secretory pathway pseudopilin PulG
MGDSMQTKNRKGVYYNTQQQFGERFGFTTIELMCTITIFMIAMTIILKISSSFQVSEKQIRTRTEMSCIANMLEEYLSLHGDYPKIEAHNDFQGNILCSALYGNINPDGDTPDAPKKVDLVTSTLIEINGKFVDPFSSDYIYYYKLRSNGDTWENSSYILLSKGSKGQQNTERNLEISKGVTITTQGRITGDQRGDIIITNGGFL